MKNKFRRFIACLLVITLMSSDIAVLAEEVVKILTLPAALQIIEEEAFYGNTSIEKVIVPDGTTEIRSRAFADSSLTEIELPDTLTSIADDAFDNCSDFAVIAEEGSYAYEWAVEKGYISEQISTPAEYFMTEIMDDGTLSITGYTGEDTDVIIPDEIDGISVKKIGEYAFECDELTSVVIPASVTNIGNRAFSYCESLKQVVMNEGVVSIGEYAFDECYKLTSVALPSSLTQIDDTAFSDCENFFVTAPEGSYAYQWAKENELLGGMALIESAHPYAAYSNETWEYTHPDDVDLLKITFSSRTYLEYDYDTLYVTDSVGTEERYTGSQLSGISIILPGNSFKLRLESDESKQYFGFAVTAIEGLSEEQLTEYLYETESVEDSTLKIVGYTEYETEVEIPKQIGGKAVTIIGSDAFTDCSITSVIIPEGVTTVEGNAFSGCDKLQGVVLPQSLIVIGEDAFSECDNMIVTAPEGSYAYEWAKENEYLANMMLIESAHPYAENSDETWEYVHPEEAVALKVTFSKRTQFESNYDTLTITDFNGVQKTYTGDELAANIVILPGNAFSIHLESDENVQYYGFGIVGIEAISEEEYEEFQQNAEFTTVIQEDGTLEITGYTGSASEIVIPARIDGKAVTSIGAKAFKNNDTITDVVISDGINKIGNQAFYDCALLENVTIPNGVKTIGEWAFAWCNSLKSIVIPDSVIEIGESAFQLSGLTEIVIPESVKVIADGLFYDCADLTSVALPYGVTTIGRSAFCYCNSLTNIELPASITSIGSYAFYQCSRLTSMEIPGSIVSIGERAFYNCNSLTDVYMEEGVEIIGQYAFSWSYSISNINIPESVTQIGEHAFDYCNGLVRITIPKGVTNIEPYAFYSCANLGNVVVSDGVTGIGSYAFAECGNLMQVTLPNSVTAIEENSFDGCEGIEIIAQEDSWAYEWAESRGLLPEEAVIESVHPYEGNSDIIWTYTHPEETYALKVTFSEKTNIDTYFDNLTITDSTGKATSYTGEELAGVRLALPGSTFDLHLQTNARWHAFGFRVTSIEAMTEEEYEEYQQTHVFTTKLLEDGTYEITGYTGNDTEYVEITLPQEIDGIPVTSVADYAFDFCSMWTSVIIPEGYVRLGKSIFINCYSISSVTIPDSLVSIGRSALGSSCPLTSITVGENNPAYCVEDGVLLTKSKDTIIRCTVNKEGVYSIPTSVTKIDAYAFSDCASITEVIIPDGVTEIGSQAFVSCDGLERIVIPSSVTELPTQVFAYCTNLEYIELSEGLIRIEDSAFQSCTALTSITIPASTVELENGIFGDYGGQRAVDVFDGCTNLEEIYVDEGNPNYSSQNGVLFNKEATILICYPAGKQGEYAIPDTVAQIGPKAFAMAMGLTRVEIPEAVTSIESRTFELCRGLTEIVLPEKLTTIKSNAFSHCSGLVEITIPDGITSLEYWVFAWCSALKKVNIPASVVSIDDDAFYCSGNVMIYAPEGSYAYEWASERHMLDNEEDRLLRSLETAVLADGTLEITEYTGDIADVVIPEEIGGVAVTSIGSYAFYESNISKVHIQSIVIPEGVTKIGDRAFCYCNSLMSVELPSTLKTLGEGVFDNCPFTEITLPEGIESIGSRAFTYCDLTTINLPDSLTYIADDAFDGCTLINVSVEEGTYAYEWAKERSLLAENVILESAHPYAGNANETWTYTHPENAYALLVTFSARTKFENNHDKLTVTAANGRVKTYTGMELAGKSIAVYGNTFDLKLTSDSGVEYFGFRITSVEEISAEDYAAKYLYETVVLDDGTLSITAYTGDAAELIIPVEIDGVQVTGIGEDAFKGCNSLTSVIIPDGVTYIGDSAFHSCSSLTSVTIPGSVVAVADYAFNSCPNLESVTLGDGVKSVGNYVFFGCALESVYAENLGGWCAISFGNDYSNPLFYADKLYIDNAELTGDVIIPDGITQIRNYLFAGCESIASVTIPEGVNSIGNSAFSNCGNLESVTIPESVTSIGDSAFSNCSNLTSVTIPEGVTSIGSSSFSYCSSLTSVTIPEGVTSIGSSAFSYCAGLYRIILPQSITEIGENVFYNSENVEIAALQNSYAYEWAEANGLLAEKAVLESMHPYANKANEEWTYTYPEEAYALKVVFSSRTAFESNHDTLVIVDAEGEERSYTGTQLAGKTLYLLGNTFSLKLTSDESGRLFGFSITAIEAATEDEIKTAVSGKVTDMLTGNAISGATVSVYRHAADEEVVIETVTDQNGIYNMNLSIDTYAIVITKDGYIAYEGELTVQQEEIEHNVSMFSIIASAQYRMVLTWGSTPSDLDSHLVGETSAGSEYHVHYSMKNAYDGDLLACNLDVDDTSGYGPEVITLTPTSDTPYYYYIYNYSGSGSIPTSGAHVTVYKGSEILYEIDAPSEGNGRYWNVLAIADGKVKLQNTITTVEDLSYVIPDSSDIETVVVSGKVTLANGMPVEGVGVYAADNDENNEMVGYTSTRDDGTWLLSLPVGHMITICLRHDDYSFSEEAFQLSINADTVLEPVTAQLKDGTGTCEAAFSMLLNGADIPEEGIRVGDTVTFEIISEDAEKVRLIVDGIAYDEYLLKGGSATANRRITRSGLRSISFQAYDGEAWGPVCEPQSLQVSSSGNLSAASIKEISTQYIGNSFHVSWEAVPNADYYTVYLYHEERLWPSASNVAEGTTSNLEIEIPGNLLYTCGEYTIEVVASGYDYDQSSAQASFTVTETDQEVAITYPYNGARYGVGDTMHTNYAVGEGVNYVKLLVIDPNGEPSLHSPGTNNVFYPVAESVGVYTLTPYYSYNTEDFTETEGYDGHGESVSVEVHAPVIDSLKRGEDTSYSHMYLNTQFSFEGSLENPRYGVRVYLNGELKDILSVDENGAFTYSPESCSAVGIYSYTFEAFWENIIGEQIVFPVYAVKKNDVSETKYVGSAMSLLGTPDAGPNIPLNYGEEVTVLGVYSDALVYGECRGYYGFFDRDLLVDTIEIEEDAILSITAKNEIYCPLGVQQYTITTSSDVGSIDVDVNYVSYDYNSPIIHREYTAVVHPEIPNTYIVEIPVTDTGVYTCIFNASNHYGASLCGFDVFEFIGIDSSSNDVGKECYSVHGDIPLRYTDNSMVIDPVNEQIFCLGYIRADGYNDMYVRYASREGGDAHYGIIRSDAVQFEVNETVRRAYILSSDHIYEENKDRTNRTLDMVMSLLNNTSLSFKSMDVNKNITVSRMRTVLNDIISVSDYNDEVYMYVFSHGYRNDDGSTGMYMEDVNNTALNNPDGFSYKTFVEKYLSKIEGKVVLILQPCYSGGIIEFAEASLDSERVSIITSCADNETSAALAWDIPLFTKKLSESCTGNPRNADSDEDGKITLEELRTYSPYRELWIITEYNIEHTQIFPEGDDETPVFW